MIIFDENIDQSVIDQIKEDGYDTLSIKATAPGISDLEVIEIVSKHSGLLITEDKDFGELVFAHGFDQISVVLLRLNKADYNSVMNALVQAIRTYYERTGGLFITIDRNKVRVTNL